MSTVQTKETVIALLGQPNSGKSTLFNGLTGLRQHVGNWPSKTVEQKEGYFTRGGVKYTVADLPGTYSLSANSDEEIITRDYIAGGKADVVVILADASQLERSLFMLADFAGIETPAVLLLNLMDVAQEQARSWTPRYWRKSWASRWCRSPPRMSSTMTVSTPRWTAPCLSAKRCARTLCRSGIGSWRALPNWRP